MRHFLAVFGIFSLVSYFFVYLRFDLLISQSFLLGVIFSIINVLLLSFGWKMIFQKKLVALAVSVIVFKYAILGILIFVAIKRWQLSAAWFAAGFGIIFPSVLVFALVKSRLDRKENGSF